jgi:hypothetical protein
MSLGVWAALETRTLVAEIGIRGAHERWKQDWIPEGWNGIVRRKYMFESIKTQLTDLAGKLTHLRRFL